MKIRSIVLAFIIGLPIISFAQLSVTTTYNRADTAVQVKFSNNSSNKAAMVLNETTMYDGGSFCDVYFIGAKGDTLSWYRCGYVTSLDPTMRLVVIQPKQQQNFTFKLARMRGDVILKNTKKIKVHIKLKHTMENIKIQKEIDYHRVFLL